MVIMRFGHLGAVLAGGFAAWAFVACSGSPAAVVNGSDAGTSSGSSGGKSASSSGNTGSSSGSSSGTSGGSSGTAGSSSGSSSGGSSGGSSGAGSGSGSSSGVAEGGAPAVVYAHTDTVLYSVDPATNVVTMIGTMSGLSGAVNDNAVTDLAIDASGNVWVNSATVLYRATLPAGGTGTVMLQKVVTIGSTNKFFALGFAPAGALASGEVLIAGDSTGSLYSIDTGSGATVDLGSFGPDPSIAGNVFELSGDVVFYIDSTSTPRGLATIRSCTATGLSCGADYLAAVNMTNLKAAITSGMPATTLLGGIYGGSGSTPGKGTLFHDVFGLAAWNGTVYGFARYSATQPAALISIDATMDATSGQGTIVQMGFGFTNGWSGAGITSSASVTVTQPPPLQ
jgi:hypothetical protein